MAIESAERLSTVSKTLFFTLRARVRESQEPQSLFTDTEAVRLLQPFERSVSRFRPDWLTRVAIVARIDIVDRQTRRYLASTPSPLVVNLGAGLCTRYHRLGRPAVDWIEIDLPDVIALRRGLLPESGHHRMIACSVTDHAWMDQIPCSSGTHPLFIADGLLMYLRDAEVKELLLAVNRRFPGSQLLTEAVSPVFSVLNALHPTLGNIGLPFHRGTIGSQRQLDRWSSGISFEDEWFLADRHPDRWGWLAPLRHVPWLRNCLKVVSLRLNGDGQRSKGGSRAPAAGNPVRGAAAGRHLT